MKKAKQPDIAECGLRVTVGEDVFLHFSTSTGMGYGISIGNWIERNYHGSIGQRTLIDWLEDVRKLEDKVGDNA